MLGSQTYIKTEREIELREFAKECGFRLRFYHEGLCAIFDKEPPSKGIRFQTRNRGATVRRV